MYRTCPCGKNLPHIAAKCPQCGREFTHQDCYPEQYSHPMVGKEVDVVQGDKVCVSGTIQRVISSRFGQLAQVGDNTETYWLLSQCKEKQCPSIQISK